MYVCDTVITLMAAYLDGELDVAESLSVQTHLEECPHCRRLYQNEKAFLDLVHAELPRPSAPSFARQNIADLLSREAATRRREKRRWAMVFSPTLLAAVAILVAFFAIPRSHVPRLVHVAVSEHKRYLAAPASLAVRSSDPHVVQGWLSARLPSRSILPLADIPEARLVGATIPQGDRRTAYLAYRFGNEAISLLVAGPTDMRIAGEPVRTFRNRFFQPATVEGRHTLLWSDRLHTYVLVAERAETVRRACVVCHSSPQGRELVAGFSMES